MKKSHMLCAVAHLKLHLNDLTLLGSDDFFMSWFKISELKESALHLSPYCMSKP